MNSLARLFPMALRRAVLPLALVVPLAPLPAFTQSQGQQPGFLGIPAPSAQAGEAPGGVRNQLGLAPIPMADPAAGPEAAELAQCQAAALGGDLEAQVRLGVLYFWGHGAPTDWAEARSWFRLAAEQGHPMAQTKLGTMYFLGQGGPMDLVQSAKWFRRAAGQGETYAQQCLGAMYAVGGGVPRDLVEAYAWLTRAKAGGDPGTSGLLLWVKAHLSPAELEEGKRRATREPADGPSAR